MATNYHMSNIRTLLREGFSETELRDFCFDTPEFRPVHDELAELTGKATLVRHLLEYADRRELLDPLLVWAEKHNPAKYTSCQPYRTTKSKSLDTVQNTTGERDDETKVLTMSRRRCCICWALEDNDSVQLVGQIAHLDRNPANSKFDNLVFLCLRHHDLYDTKTSQSKGFTKAEVSKYRDELYKVFSEKNRSHPFHSLEGFRRAGVKSVVTFPVAFPATPIVLISAVSKKPCMYTLSDISTTGFTINWWDVVGEPVKDVAFNWLAYLDNHKGYDEKVVVAQ